MRDDEIQPVSPVHGVRALRPVEIPRHPGYGQLRKWMAFSKRLAARKQNRAQPEEREEGDRPDPGHIDEYC